MIESLQMTSTPREERFRRVVYFLFLGVAISIFFANEPTRTIITDNKFNQNFNIPYLLTASCLLLLLLHRQLIRRHIFFLSVFFMGIVLISLVYSDRNYVQYLIFISNMFLPILLSDFKMEPYWVKRTFNRFLGIYNVLIYLLVITGLIDYLTNASIQLFFATRGIFNNDWSELVLIEHGLGIYRYYSLIGHPLVNSWYLLVFFALNHIQNIYFKPKVNKFVLVILTLLGLILSGSKTAIAIGVVFVLLFTRVKKNKVLFYIGLAIAGTGLFFSPLFQENLLQRFVIGIEAGDLGEGRSEALSYVIHGWVERPHFFVGGGAGYSRSIVEPLGFIKSFEYPSIMFMYDVSIVGTVILYMIIFFFPVIGFLRRKHYTVTFMYASIFLYMNGMNAIANYTDYMGQLAVFLFLFKSLSRLIYEERSETLDGLKGVQANNEKESDLR